jgi:TetR/AcrR family transcriptional repressor of mexJK operon
MTPTEAHVVTDTRQRLLEAAREAFMKEGYRASVDNIAARAGVAKQTLYNHFPGKDELFSETATLSSAAIAVALDGETDDVRATLIRFATTFREKILGVEGLAMFRALTSETTRFPALAPAFFAKGPAKTVSRLADFLGRAMADGRLRKDDPRFAAEMLMSMLGGIEHFSRLCGTATPAASEKIRIAKIVDCYLSAYAPHY